MNRDTRGIIIFLLMQILFINLGLAMYFGMKHYKQKLDMQRAQEIAAPSSSSNALSE